MPQQATTPYTIECLPKAQQPLLNKFYRSHDSRMQATHPAESWVMRNPLIIAGVCITPISDGYWLTSLFVDPRHRQHGAGQNLLRHIQNIYSTSPIWLFCHPDLTGFYQKTGFQITQQLPDQLKNRLTRYQRNKKLIAMTHSRSPISAY